MVLHSKQLIGKKHTKMHFNRSRCKKTHNQILSRARKALKTRCKILGLGYQIRKSYVGIDFVCFPLDLIDVLRFSFVFLRISSVFSDFVLDFIDFLRFSFEIHRFSLIFLRISSIFFDFLRNSSIFQ